MKRKNILYIGLDPSRYPHEGELVHLPIIRTVPRPFDHTIEQAFRKLTVYTHILFTSRTTIPIYQSYALKAGFSENVLREKSYVCVGKATAAYLKEMGLQATYIAQEETGEGVVSILKGLSLHRKHLFFPRSAQGRDLIPCYLKKEAIPFTSVDLYDTLPNSVELPDLERFDEIIFTSPSTVHAFFRLVKEYPPSEKCRALGPITEKILNEYFLN